MTLFMNKHAASDTSLLKRRKASGELPGAAAFSVVGN